jgi:hypothetical protein
LLVRERSGSHQDDRRWHARAEFLKALTLAVQFERCSLAAIVEEAQMLLCAESAALLSKAAGEIVRPSPE